MEKIARRYARWAKKMDKRQLKAIEWDLLTSRLLKTNNKENNVANKDSVDEGIDPKSAKSTTFAKLYKELHSSKMMPPKVFKFFKLR